MIDFTDKRVYERERKKYKQFLENKLVTESEYNSEADEDGFDFSDGDSGVIDTASVMGGEAVDFGGGSDFDAWGEDSEVLGKTRQIDLANDTSYIKDTWWENFLWSPWYLVLYVAKLFAYDFPDKEDWKGILKSLNKITIFSALTGGVMWVTDTVFLISAPFQTITSLLMFATSFLILRYVYGEGRETIDADDSGIDFSGTNFEEETEAFGDDEVLDISSIDGVDDSGEVLEDEDDVYEEVDSSDSSILAPSPITVENDKVFDKGLLNVFASNSIYEGTEIKNRRALLESMAGYIVTNDKTYGSWKLIRERSVEYNNIVYSLFKGLGQMNTAFLTDEESLIVRDVRSSPLLYKIEVELPNYFKEKMVTRNLDEIENVLKRGEDDVNVSVTCSTYRGVFVFKFLRLDNENMVSLGDILRFYDETKDGTAMDEFSDDDKGMPMLLGLRENEYPYVVDLEGNTSGTIVGGSGSGKSWLTFLVMWNLVLSNDYNNVQFIVLDVKDAQFWNQFAKFPHVLGYHTNYKHYLELLREITEEVERRKKLMNEIGAEDVKGYRKKMRKEKNYEGLKEVPLLNIVIDEITSTMNSLETMYADEKETYNEIRGMINNITQIGRSVGVRLILIGQRATTDSIPKNAMQNSSFKFAMRMESDNDFNLMYGDDAKKLKKPTSMGLGLARNFSQPGIYMIKTLTIGGVSNDQMIKMIRVLALEWVRRSKGLDDIINQPENTNFNLIYNRDKFAMESFKELEEGRILNRKKVDRGYSMQEINGLVRNYETEDAEDLGDGDKEDYPDERERTNYEPMKTVETEVGKFTTPSLRVSDEEVPQPEVENANEIKISIETPLIKKVDTEQLKRESVEMKKDEQKPKQSSYVEDEDDDLFGSWDGDVVISVNTDKVNEDETDISKITETPEDATVVEDGDYSEMTLEQLLAREQAMEMEHRQREKIDRESELLSEHLRTERKKADITPITPENNTVSVDTEIVHSEGTPETLDLLDIQVESVMEPGMKEFHTEKPKLKPISQELQKENTVRQPPKQEIKKDAKPTRSEEITEKSSGAITIDFLNEGARREDKTSRQNIKQYIIENGERDGMLNRRMLCEELESVYPQAKIEQALDMLLIIQDRGWYITKL